MAGLSAGNNGNRFGGTCCSDGHRSTGTSHARIQSGTQGLSAGCHLQLNGKVFVATPCHKGRLWLYAYRRRIPETGSLLFKNYIYTNGQRIHLELRCPFSYSAFRRTPHFLCISGHNSMIVTVVIHANQITDGQSFWQPAI